MLYIIHPKARRASKIKVFEAGVYNIVYFFQKTNGSQNKPERRVHDPIFGAVNLLPTDEQKNLNYRVFFPEDSPKTELNINALKLSEICYISVGMVANANEKLANGLFGLKDLLSDIKSEIHSKPFVEGKNLKKWILIQNKYIEWGTSRSPSLLRRPTFPELYEQDSKLMLPMVGEIRAALDMEGLYCNHGIFVAILWCNLKGINNKSISKSADYGYKRSKSSDLPIREKLEENSSRFSEKYLLGIINSSVSRNFLKQNRRNNVQLYPDDWKNLPIPDVSTNQQQPIVELVDKILDAKGQNVKQWEQEIDAIVARLYGLSEDEMKIIRGEK